MVVGKEMSWRGGGICVRLTWEEVWRLELKLSDVATIGMT
jgi:hypothetical protein